MRIIGGKLRGRRLATIPGKSIRPTADRVKEALFNILADRLPGSAVLDLFAGTGALALEALSRGAQSALFVDNRQKALDVLRLNIQSLGLADHTRVVRWDIARNLNCLRGMIPRFDLVFIDPPYHTGLIRPSLVNLCSSRAMADGAVIVVEHGYQDPVPEDLPALTIMDRRRYAKTLVSFLSYVL